MSGFEALLNNCSLVRVNAMRLFEEFMVRSTTKIHMDKMSTNYNDVTYRGWVKNVLLVFCIIYKEMKKYIFDLVFVLIY
jgi:hypothetical protein